MDYKIYTSMLAKWFEQFIGDIIDTVQKQDLLKAAKLEITLGGHFTL